MADPLRVAIKLSKTAGRIDTNLTMNTSDQLKNISGNEVLLVDDNPENLRLLSEMLSDNGYGVRSARSGLSALKYLEQNSPHVILLDIKMPDMDGFEVCRQIKANKKINLIPIIFISALADIEDKVAAFSVGGVDYITKPFQEAEVLVRVRTHTTIQQVQNKLEQAYEEVEFKIVERTEELNQEAKRHQATSEELKKVNAQLQALKEKLEIENQYLQSEIRTVHNFGEIIGSSESLKKVLMSIEQVAPSETSVLLLGETGTGKELFVRAIHNLSKRNHKPLVKVNCAALPENLIESELFGHEKGAFTGATAQKLGRFELADMGTIFLDELGDLPLALQAKLLRVLQEGEFERLGSTKTRRVDVRVLAATNRDLDKLRSEGNFRDDLYYRLSAFPINIPPLRDRIEDLPKLVYHFTAKYAKKAGKKIESISNQYIRQMQGYDWPGNIRELENEIERAVLLSSRNQLTIENWSRKSTKPVGHSTMASMDECQRTHIIKVLEATNGKIKGSGGAAEVLKMKPSTLISRMKKLGVKIDRQKVDISSEFDN